MDAIGGHHVKTIYFRKFASDRRELRVNSIEVHYMSV
jgi:hypothetical protein